MLTLKSAQTSTYKSKARPAGLLLPAAHTHGVLSLRGTQSARQPEGCSSPGGPSEQSAGASTNQRQAGSRAVGANLSPDIYHFLRNTLKDFYLRVLLHKNSINATIVSPLGCLHSISLMSWEEKWRGHIGKVSLLPGTRESSLTPPSFSCPPEPNPLPSSRICHLNVCISLCLHYSGATLLLLHREPHQHPFPEVP